MLFLQGIQLILRPSVLTILDLNEVDVTLKNAEIFGSVLSGECGSVGGGWRCCRSAIGLPPTNRLGSLLSLFPWRWEQPVQHPITRGLVNFLGYQVKNPAV